MTAPFEAPSFRLDGRRALVTGASRGIGQHAALTLADAGADVVLAGRDKAALADVAAQVRELGRNATPITAELANPSDVERLAEEALAAYNGLDILVNNAGVAPVESVLDTSVDVLDEAYAVNLRAPLLLAARVARAMVDAGRGGKIINIASAAGQHAIAGHVAYGAAKAGLVLATKVMALELAPHNIQVNVICPTVILTPMGLSVWGDPAKAEPMLAKIPAGRFGQPGDVSAAIRYLASPAADLVTGTELTVDGGYGAV
ncbi:MAG TPA: glucose 1-dehydrogenase [Actinopolymorphaceae bacterium]|jgi:NAD(P)-dependent dehydrogenase (short-subunit alcohol dehydrogenase family)